MKRNTLIALLLSASATLSAAPKYYAYLFTYFTGNRPSQEQISYALSKDGYNYIPLNEGKPVVSSDTIALKHCVRDPHILRGNDGKTFYMVVTDMKSDEGWASNRGMVLMKSTDLIHWTHSAIHFPTKYPEKWGNVTRVWAPETIYDPDAKRYMVFYSLRTSDADSYDKIYYSYVNDTFTDLIGEPTYLYDRGSATIDGDIVYNKKDRLYHLFFKNEGERGICQVTSKTLTAPEGSAPGSQWSAPSSPIQQTKENVEGVGVFQTIDQKGWIVMYDCYVDHHYQFCSSSDLQNFKFEQNTETKGAFTPRHGTVIPITFEEAQRLAKQFPSNGLENFFQEPAKEKSKATKQIAAIGNPVLPGLYADPEILYSHKTGKYYLYPTSDGFEGWGGHTFNVFESKDLRKWTNKGQILDLATDQVSWATGNAWAPCIEEKLIDGKYKYFFYFSGHNPELNRKTIGVAIADDPTGPFTDLGHPILTDSPVGHGQQIDADVFTDPTNGKSYLYWGNGYMAGAELNDDMTSIKKETLTVMTPTKNGNRGTLSDFRFREGTYVFYRKGLYYFLWSVDDTGVANYHVAYGISTSPLGPIHVAESPIVLNQKPEEGILGTAHNSILQRPGTDEWYIVYHRLNKDYYDNNEKGRGFHREVCIDRMYFNPDGTIKQVIPTHTGAYISKKR